MSETHEFAALLLRRSARSMAAYAATELLEQSPGAGSELGPDRWTIWRRWLEERVEELAVALQSCQPHVLEQPTKWAICWAASRGVDLQAIRQGLVVLCEVLATELPEAAAALARQSLNQVIAKIDFHTLSCESLSSSEALTTKTPVGQLTSRYLLALLEGDRQKATQLLLGAVRDGWSLLDLYSRVLTPALQEVGRLWVTNEITIAEEHFATATTKLVMPQLRSAFPSQESNGKTVLAASVSENHHDLGLQMITDIFELHGWRTIALGANVPIVDFVQAAEAFDADLLLISAALASQVPIVQETIAAIRNYAPTADTKVIVGGAAFLSAPELAEQCDADGYATDIAGAYRLGKILVGLSS